RGNRRGSAPTRAARVRARACEGGETRAASRPYPARARGRRTPAARRSRPVPAALPEVAMKLALSLAALAALVLAAPPARATLPPPDPHIYTVTPSHRIRLEFPVGELKVIPSDDARVRFDLKVRCDGRWNDDCEERANQLILDSDDTGGTLHLKLHKYPQWH